MKTPTKSKRVALLMTDEEYETLREWSHQERKSMSDLIMGQIRPELLDRLEKKFPVSKSHPKPSLFNTKLAPGRQSTNDTPNETIYVKPEEPA